MRQRPPPPMEPFSAIHHRIEDSGCLGGRGTGGDGTGPVAVCPRRRFRWRLTRSRTRACESRGRNEPPPLYITPAGASVGARLQSISAQTKEARGGRSPSSSLLLPRLTLLLLVRPGCSLCSRSSPVPSAAIALHQFCGSCLLTGTFTTPFAS